MVADFFVGGSNRNIAINKVIRTFDEKSLYSVVSIDRLLSSAGRKEALKNIRAAVIELPEEYYGTLYQELINSFISFVQILPVNNEARLASLMDEGLMRALYALQVYQKSSNDEVDPVMPYVLFSASLLFDIGCVIADRTIVISEEDGSFIRVWDPFYDSAMQEGSYYKVRQGGGLTPWSIRRSAITLACKLMPAIGFDWIYKNPHAFNIWLALLVDDKEGAGLLSFSFERARELLEEFKISAETFAPVEVEELEGDATKNAEAFVAWLKNRLSKGLMAEGQIYQIENDNKLFISKDILKQFLSGAARDGVTYEELELELEKIGLTFSPLSISLVGSLAREIRTRLGAAASMTLFNTSDSKPTVTNTNKTTTALSSFDGVRALGGYVVSGLIDNLAYVVNSGVRSSVSFISRAALGMAPSSNLPALDQAENLEKTQWLKTGNLEAAQLKRVYSPS